MEKKYTFVVINSGSTSTKVSIFENVKKIMLETISHSSEEIHGFKERYDQFYYRKEINFENVF